MYIINFFVWKTEDNKTNILPFFKEFPVRSDKMVSRSK